jgi:2-polyprenyl-3-methyl-5-hydroxy-6-metoxy-1,4-benzoquinol methylase
MPSQEIFETCYRQRQGGVHHLAYMRLSKVLLAMQMIERSAIELNGRSILDYGFGAGTFFRHCPVSAALYGLEIDADNVAAVAKMLKSRGHHKVDLQVLDPDHWAKSPLLDRRYDVILCSHVLEHLENPVELLRCLARCLNPGGKIVGLVPINERTLNPYHVRPIDNALVERWTTDAGLSLVDYVEADPWIYWLQPLYATHAPLKHKLAQAVSLGLGTAAATMGGKAWVKASLFFARITRSKPTQAGFILRSDNEQATSSRPL